MRKKLQYTIFAGLAGLFVAGPSLADCAGASVAEVRSAYDRARELERAGMTPAALAAYVKAQDVTCEANPVELDAAKHAAALARPLAVSAERAGDLARAFDAYESGGWFAEADRVLMTLVRKETDDHALYDRAVRHLEIRTLPSFASNNRTRIGVTGAYHPDAAMLQALTTLPAKRATDALAKEARAVDEAWLRAVVEAERTKPADPTDFAAVQAAMQAQQDLAMRFAGDPLAESRKQLRNASAWAQRDRDASRARGFETRVALRYADRANLLVKSYSAAPRLLGAAMDYYRDSTSDAAHVATELGQVRALAARLGDQAARAERYLVAAEYYEVADESVKAEDARERMNALAQRRMVQLQEMTLRVR